MAHILVVDDQAAMAEVVSAVLVEAGYTASQAGTAAAARSQIEEKRIDGAIIDVWLGGEDGLDLAASILADHPGFRFVIMSGGGPGRTLELVTAKADALGAHGVLYKPFDDDELLHAVTKMLGDAALGTS